MTNVQQGISKYQNSFCLLYFLIKNNLISNNALYLKCIMPTMAAFEGKCITEILRLYWVFSNVIYFKFNFYNYSSQQAQPSQQVSEYVVSSNPVWTLLEDSAVDTGLLLSLPHICFHWPVLLTGLIPSGTSSER